MDQKELMLDTIWRLRGLIFLMPFLFLGDLFLWAVGAWVLAALATLVLFIASSSIPLLKAKLKCANCRAAMPFSSGDIDIIQARKEFSTPSPLSSKILGFIGKDVSDAGTLTENEFIAGLNQALHATDLICFVEEKGLTLSERNRMAFMKMHNLKQPPRSVLGSAFKMGEEAFNNEHGIPTLPLAGDESSLITANKKLLARIYPDTFSPSKCAYAIPLWYRSGRIIEQNRCPECNKPFYEGKNNI